MITLYTSMFFLGFLILILFLEYKKTSPEIITFIVAGIGFAVLITMFALF